jgi:hypothetical protein
VAQNPPHSGHSRACSAQHAQTVLWRWQIPSFVPAQEPAGTLWGQAADTPGMGGTVRGSGADMDRDGHTILEINVHGATFVRSRVS